MEKLRTELTKEYYEKEMKVKGQEIEVYYKYWDGFQQVQKLRLKKDTKISIFTECIRQELQIDYPDMRSINGEYGLMYVLDNTIVPSTVSFFDVLKNKVRGPNGLLLETKLIEDEGYEVQTNTVGMIITKKFYEKNKHCYPLKNWKHLNLTLID